MQQHLTAQEWARRVQLDRAQGATAHGITHTTGAKVGGAHLSDAANEPEPSSAEDVHLAEVSEVERQRIAADLARDVNKGERLAARNDAHAMDLQIQLQGYIGGLS